MINSLFDNINVYEKGLDAAAKRNSVLLNNIANVDTKGYKASDISFEEEFKKALSSETDKSSLALSSSVKVKSNPKHFDISSASVRSISDSKTELTTNDGSSRLDENSVDIDSEMTKFVDNIIRYQFLIQKVNSEVTNLKTAIGGGS